MDLWRLRRILGARERRLFDWNWNMSSLKAKFGILVAGLLLSGCMQTATYQSAPEASLKPADKAQLAKAKYAKVVNEPFRRAIVDYHRKEMPGSIVVDSDNHYLYLVQDGGKAIRYGITVGEEALAFSGIAKVGNMAEWPKWTPTADIHKRIEGLPASVPGGVDNPLGARALYLYQGGRDTLFRIHGTNQPEYIGASISSGCIRMTNEDVIDLYSRVKMGTVVVVLEPKHGDSPYNSKMALQGGNSGPMMQ
jgi:lipoprotein-anchoring transpeptidase ErfK/SrfK